MDWATPKSDINPKMLSVPMADLLSIFKQKKEVPMSGECEKCSEHCLECKCVSAREKWLSLPYEMRLFLAEYIFKAITQEPGCSFRRLIYNRLEFEPKSYADLYHAGGMLITNAMCDSDHLEHCPEVK
jgi:hypothetical protein